MEQVRGIAQEIAQKRTGAQGYATAASESAPLSINTSGPAGPSGGSGGIHTNDTTTVK